MTTLKNKAKKRLLALVAISFFYTIFCAYTLDFTTIYGIIDKLNLKDGHNMLCDFKKNVQDIVMDRYNDLRKKRKMSFEVGGNERI